MERLYTIECLLTFIILYVLFRLVSFIQRRKFGDVKNRLLVNFAFLLIGWIGYMFSLSVFYYLGNYLTYIVYLSLVGLDFELVHSSMRRNSLLLTVVISGVAGFLSSLATYPIFERLENWRVFYAFVGIPDVTVPFFYMLIPLFCMTSGLFCYLVRAHLDLIAHYFFDIAKTTNAKLGFKSLLAHLQLVAIGLLPLFVIQVFLGSALLSEVTELLYFFVASQMYLIWLCLAVAFFDKIIFGSAFLRINSVFALIAFISSIYAAVQFISFQIDSGAYRIAVILSSLFSSAIGIYFSRASSLPRNGLN